jgi:hypothetical protein
LKLISAHDGQGAVASRGIESRITVIKMVVDDDDRTIVPAERAPADIVISIIPMHPGRAPGAVGNPVPAQTEPPLPASVVIYAPAPGLIRNPGPTADRIPGPPPLIVGPPIGVGNSWNPNVSEWPLIRP